jgi:putative hydrolase of the HAD superfamily
MSLGNFKVLTFDLMGTLIDYEGGILGYVRPIALRAGLHLTDTAILEACAKAEEDQNKSAPDRPYTRALPIIYSDMATALGLPHAVSDADGFGLSLPDWRPFPDSLEALKRLRKRFRLVAMTNADNWAYNIMSRTLAEPFHDKVTAEDVGTNKPDPQNWAYCLGRQSVHGYSRQDFLHVAQSQYHDIGAAKRLGYATCWIERRKGKEGFGGTPVPEAKTVPNYHFATLGKLADAVDADR